MAIAVALRVVAYAERSVLWLDEAATARNIAERSLSQLLTIPLDYGQAAPKGFLLLEWIATRMFGTSPLAFRLVPFLCGVASVFLFLAVARRLLSPLGTVAALLFFAVGYWFLVYSADTHPYPLDLALSLGALLIAIDLQQRGFPARRVWGAALYGAVAVWCSNATLLALFGLGMSLGAIAWQARGLRAAASALWPIALLWGVSAAAAAWVAAHSSFPDSAEYLRAIWQGAMVPRSPGAARWLFNAWRTQLALWHGWWVDNPTWTSLYVALALVGFVSLLLRRTAGAILVGSVVAAYIVVSMTKQYPYESRLVLPSIAVFMLGIGESIGTLADAAWGRARVVPRALAVLLCVPPLYRVVAYPPPYQWTVTGSYLAQIRGRWQPGDVVYATYERAMEVVQSAPRFGLRREDYVVGPCDVSDARVPLRAVDALRGRRRVWMIVGTGFYFPFSPEYAYARAIGVRRDSLPVRLAGSIRNSDAEPFDIGTAYLFDLSDSTRLARAAADTYELSPLVRRAFRARTRWNCYGVWDPLKKASARGESGTGNRERSSRASGV